MIVLATAHHFPLFRTTVPRSRLSCLFPPKILAIARRISRSIASPLLLASTLRYYMSDMYVAIGIHAVSWTPSVVHARLHMVQEESGDEIELLRAVGLHRAIPSVGLDGIQFGRTWSDS
jgi:hypothetical protein